MRIRSIQIKSRVIAPFPLNYFPFRFDLPSFSPPPTESPKQSSSLPPTSLFRRNRAGMTAAVDGGIFSQFDGFAPKQGGGFVEQSLVEGRRPAVNRALGILCSFFDAFHDQGYILFEGEAKGLGMGRNGKEGFGEREQEERSGWNRNL